MLASRAVATARAYDKIVPNIPHALHMPTHIFVRLGIIARCCQLEYSFGQSCLEYPANGSISHHYPHAIDYLIYAYLQEANDTKAKDLLGEIREKENYQKTSASGYALAAIPARYVLERKQWAKAAALDERSPEAFPWGKFPEVESITYFARGLGAAQGGNAASEALKSSMHFMSV